MSQVLAYYRYLGKDSQTVYNTQYFCGACTRKIGGCYAFPEYPSDLEAENEADLGFWREKDRPLDHFSFCPWCGAEFEDEWWKDQPIQNERVIDHFQNPGHHKGDTHEFRGTGPDCIAGHHLASSDSNHICWCEPEVIPGIMGCVIRHQDKSHEEYRARCEAEAEERFAADSDEEEDEW